MGSYELVSLVGAGAMGEVYRARDTKPGRDVALKTLPAAFALDLGLSDVAPDNSRALLAMPTALRPPALHVLVNWQGH